MAPDSPDKAGRICQRRASRLDGVPDDGGPLQFSRLLSNFTDKVPGKGLVVWEQNGEVSVPVCEAASPPRGTASFFQARQGACRGGDQGQVGGTSGRPGGKIGNSLGFAALLTPSSNLVGSQNSKTEDHRTLLHSKPSNSTKDFGGSENPQRDTRMVDIYFYMCVQVHKMCNVKREP